MIKGIEVFQKHFAGLAGGYVVIGGAACDLLFAQSALPFRATRDLDIVLCMEGEGGGFARKFWEFVKTGGYQAQTSADGARRLYRFCAPTAPGYPAMLELFAPRAGAFAAAATQTAAPVPMPEDASSLSAILLDDEYHELIVNNRMEVEGVSVLAPAALIVLKAKAWLDLTARKDGGENVDSKNVKKHRNDVLRLSALLTPATALALPPNAQAAMRAFLDSLTVAANELRQLGIRQKPEALLGLLRDAFML
ncbi:MAG: hypothetical protein J6333_10190 [Planctomycetes bacterium]|nr:hypothetical protein [Planctomycetota bacterium]